MILSKLALDMRNPSARQALRNCQDMHRNLMRAFAGDRSAAGVLYRLMERRDRIEIYVLSRETPHWEALCVQGYRCEAMRDISALRERCREGAVLQFDLLACPAKKVPGAGKNSKRVFLNTQEERLDWLKRQGEKCGFALLDAREAEGCKRITGRKDSAPICFGAVRFRGKLRITDAERFWNGYQAGIGSEKSYGMGLMTLQRSAA